MLGKLMPNYPQLIDKTGHFFPKISRFVDAARSSPDCECSKTNKSRGPIVKDGSHRM